jgi:tetratricopeptide (TPR) repeat protein
MSRVASFTLFVASLPALAASRGACDAALPLAADPVLLTTCGGVFLRAGDLTQARQLLESALSLWQSLLGPADCQVGTTARDLALVHRMAGRYELSEQYARTALGIYEACYGPKSMMLNYPLTSLAAAEIMLRRYADAESHLNLALSLVPPVLMRDEPEAGAVFSSLGLLHYKRGRYFEAEQWYRRAGATPGSTLDSARTLANLARVYSATARYDQADAMCSRSLHLLTGLLGQDHAEICAPLQILAQVRQRQKRYGEAADLLKQALDIAVRVSGPGSLNESIILANIGVAHVLDGRPAEGEGPLRRAILIQERLGGNARGELSTALHDLAIACDKQGRHAEALDLSSRALAMREADLPGGDPVLLEIMLQKAKLLRQAHRRAEAVKLERVARQARAARSDEDQNRWVVDFRELQNKKPI